MMRPGLRPATDMSLVRTSAASAGVSAERIRPSPGCGTATSTGSSWSRPVRTKLQASGPVARRIRVEQRVVLEGSGGTCRHRLPRWVVGPAAPSGWLCSRSGNRAYRSATRAASRHETLVAEDDSVGGQAVGTDTPTPPRVWAPYRSISRSSCSGRGADARLRVEQVGGHEPADLELDAVGVLGVERLRGAVVGGADERAVLGEHAADPLRARRACRPPRRGGRGRRCERPAVESPARVADREQAEVVVVGGVRRPAGTPPAPGSP